jgi:hypothetical protein
MNMTIPEIINMLLEQTAPGIITIEREELEKLYKKQEELGELSQLRRDAVELKRLQQNKIPADVIKAWGTSVDSEELALLRRIAAGVTQIDEGVNSIIRPFSDGQFVLYLDENMNGGFETIAAAFAALDAAQAEAAKVKLATVRCCSLCGEVTESRMSGHNGPVVIDHEGWKVITVTEDRRQQILKDYDAKVWEYTNLQKEVAELNVRNITAAKDGQSS